MESAGAPVEVVNASTSLLNWEEGSDEISIHKPLVALVSLHLKNDSQSNNPPPPELASMVSAAAATASVYHPPLLGVHVAGAVSSLSTATRFSLRMASVTFNIIFSSLKFTTAASLGLSRRAVVGALTSARTLHSASLESLGFDVKTAADASP